MARAELLGLVMDAFVYDDHLARKVLGDALKEEGWEEDGAALARPLIDFCLACPVCGPPPADNANYTEHRFEDDECGDFLCVDLFCWKCTEPIETIVLRPTCRHTYDCPVTPGGFKMSEAMRMRHAD